MILLAFMYHLLFVTAIFMNNISFNTIYFCKLELFKNYNARKFTSIFELVLSCKSLKTIFGNKNKYWPICKHIKFVQIKNREKFVNILRPTDTKVFENVHRDLSMHFIFVMLRRDVQVYLIASIHSCS